MQTITLFNEKGGVGKTTLAGTIGAGLALRGYKVIMLDADAQAHLTINVGLPKSPGFYDFMQRPQIPLLDKTNPDNSLMVRVPEKVCQDGILYMVAGNKESGTLAMKNDIRDMVTVMARRYHQLENFFDYVVIDTSPTSNAVHDAVVYFSDWVLIPTDPEAFGALDSVSETMADVAFNRASARGHGRDVGKILGIVSNKFRSRTLLHQNMQTKLETEYGDLVLDPIPLRTAIAESQLAHQFLMQAAPELDVTSVLWKLIDNVIARTQGGHHVQK